MPSNLAACWPRLRHAVLKEPPRRPCHPAWLPSVVNVARVNLMTRGGGGEEALPSHGDHSRCLHGLGRGSACQCGAASFDTVTESLRLAVASLVNRRYVSGTDKRDCFGQSLPSARSSAGVFTTRFREVSTTLENGANATIARGPWVLQT